MLAFRIRILFTRSHTFFGNNNVTIDDIRILFFVTFTSWKYTIIFVYFDTSDTTSFSDFDQELTIHVGVECWRRNRLVKNIWKNWKNQNFQRLFSVITWRRIQFRQFQVLFGSSLFGIIGFFKSVKWSKPSKVHRRSLIPDFSIVTWWWLITLFCFQINFTQVDFFAVEDVKKRPYFELTSMC